MTMGLEPMPVSEWMEIDEFYEQEMRQRLELFDEQIGHRSVVLAGMPEAEPAKLELLEMLADYLPMHFPDMFSVASGRLHNHVTGESFSVASPETDPLEVCARMVQEDLCLVLQIGGQQIFVAGAVLFPNRWSLNEKIGMNMTRVHDPVPFFFKEVNRPVNSFMERMVPDKPFWRINWAIKQDPELFQPLVEEDIRAAVSGAVATVGRKAQIPLDQVPISDLGEHLFTRCERETLRRLPRSGAILFTIRTHTKPLSQLATRPEDAQRVADAFRALPPEMLRYKSMEEMAPLIVSYLDHVLAGHRETNETLVGVTA